MQGPPGYNYHQPHGYPPPHGYPQPPPKKKGIGGWGIAGIVALCVFGGCGAICAVGMKGAGDKAAADKKAFDDEKPIDVTAAELVQAYEDNEVGADSKYKGKKLRISGVITSIDSGYNDMPIVQLEGKQFKGVSVNGLDKTAASNLKKGAKVSFICKGAGEVIGFPSVDDCKAD